MKFSNLIRNSFLALFVLFVILAAFVVPAAADDPALASNLGSTNPLSPEGLAPNQTKTVTYILDFPLGSGAITDPGDDPLPYAFNITIFNPDLVHGPASNLVLILSSVNFDADEFLENSTMPPISGVDPVTGHSYVTYYFDDLPAKGSISFDLLINGNLVYPNETATIGATLSQLDENGDWISFNIDCTNEIVVDYSLSSTNLVSRSDFSLTKPLLLPTGESGKSIFVLAKSSLIYSLNMTGPNSDYYYYSYVVDFSNVDITANGVTKTYSQWLLSNPNNAPVYFVSTVGHDVSDLTALSFNEFDSAELSAGSINLLPGTYDTSKKYNSSNVSFPFLIIINENFIKNGVTDPSIDLRNVSMDVKFMVNDKGDVETLGFYKTGTGPSSAVFSIEGPDLVWGGGHSLDLNVYRYNENRTVVTSSGGSSISQFGHLLSNSFDRNDDNGRFKYQELFTMGLINAVPGDVVINVEVPANVTLTHLRIPGPDTAYSNYTSFTIENSSGEVDVTGHATTGGNGSALITLPSGSFVQGEDITLKFHNLGYFKTHEESPLNFIDTNLIDFVGMTHGVAGSSVSFTVNASYDSTSSTGDKTYYNFNEGYFVNTTFSYTLVDSYSITVLNDEIRFSGDGISNNVVSEWEYPFYMDMNISPSKYPYLGTYRSNPLDPYNTTTLPNPAVYFVVPDTLKYIPESATIVGQSVGIGLEETIVTNAAGNDVVIIRIGNETAPGNGILNTGEKYLLNDSITVRFAVSVSDTFKSDSLQVPAYTLLGGSWDPQAVGLSGVWNTQTIRLSDPNIDIPSVTMTDLGLVPYGTYYGAPLLTSPAPCLSKNVKVSANNSTSLPFTQNPNRGISSNAPEFKANTDGVFTLNLKSKDMDEGPSNATAIFVLPNRGFKPELTGISFRDGSDLPTTFNLQYTTQSLTPGSVSYSDTISWTSATYNSGSRDFSLQSGDSFAAITAVKLDVISYQGALNLSMPFHVSNLSDPNNLSSSAILGQTLYEFEGSSPVDKGYTPAIKYSPTDAPMLRWNDGSGNLVLMGNSVDFNYDISDSTALLAFPRWNDVSVVDDDIYVGLESVTISFTPKDTTITAPNPSIFNSLGVGTQSNPSADDWRSAYSIIDTAGFVNLQTVGTYKITYKTAADIDNRSTTQTYTLNVVKQSGTITLESGIGDQSQTFFMDEYKGSASTVFDDLSWIYTGDETLGTDNDGNSNGGAGISLKPTDFELENNNYPSNFYEIPGVYTLDYTYTDLALNTKTITVTLTVKYAGTLTIDTKFLPTGDDLSDLMAGTPVTLNVSVNGGAVTQATFNPTLKQYTVRLEGDPLHVNGESMVEYTISVDNSTLPKGLKEPVAISGTAGVSDPGQVPELVADPSETFNFDPITITTIIVGDSDKVVSGSVVLHDNSSGDTGIAPIFTATPDTYKFEASGNWFDDAFNYSMLISLEPGYEVDVSGQFPGIESTIPSVLEANTEEFELNHLDIVYTFSVRESPLISGYLWGDNNRNSLDDDGIVIAGATVKLLEDDGVTEIGSTQTDANGYYYLTRDHGLNETMDFYLQVLPPAGYNRASPVIAGGDQEIDPDAGFKSVLISIGTFGGSGVLHHAVGGGFYYQPSGGNGFGSATIVDNGNQPGRDNPSDVGNDNQSGDDSGNQSDDGSGNQPGINDEAGAGKRFSILGLIVLILSIITGLIQLFIAGNRGAKKLIDVHRTLRIIIAVLMIVVAVIFLLTYDFTGKMILYYWIDLVLAVIFIGQLILIGRIFRAKTN